MRTSGTSSSRHTAISWTGAARHRGCLDLAITADPIDPGRINNYERWESWDAIEAWRARADAPDTGIAMRNVDVMAFEVASTRPPF
jgi:hypothetical protein